MAIQPRAPGLAVRHRRMRRIAVTGLLVALAACANDPMTVDVVYRPLTASPVAGAERVGLTILATDVRVDNRDRISATKNGRGMNATPIVASQNVVAVVRDAISAELAQRGFRIGQGGTSLVIEIAAFYNDFRFSYASGDSVAAVAFNARVQAADGRVTFERLVVGRSHLHAVPFATPDEAKRALELALSDAVEQLLGQPQFLSALLGA